MNPQGYSNSQGYNNPRELREQVPAQNLTRWGPEQMPTQWNPPQKQQIPERQMPTQWGQPNPPTFQLYGNGNGNGH